MVGIILKRTLDYSMLFPGLSVIDSTTKRQAPLACSIQDGVLAAGMTGSPPQ